MSLTAALFAVALPAAALAQDTHQNEDAPPSDAPSRAESLEKFRQHVPGKGVALYRGDEGEIDFSLFATIRYLNQSGLDSTYTNSSGTVVPLDRRDDLQFQKVILYFKGWLGVPEFRYLTYVWTSNTSQGQGAQVVVAGNFTYQFNRAVGIGAGINSLPTVRSTRGTFPRWLRQDARTMADDYFRGSYTSGVWAWGDLTNALHYQAMIGDNLSQLGVDAAQMDMGMNTYSGALWWTSAGFGKSEGNGDFKPHTQLASSVGAAFTSSREDKQSQPGTEAPENSQIRISDGQQIFTTGVFAPGVQINDALYRMAAFDGALKYRGVALEGSFYSRWVGDFHATGALPVNDLIDTGYEVQLSGMVMPSTLMLYGFASGIQGQYGNPSEFGFGANFYPFKSPVLRVNGDVMFDHRSPVGNLASPMIVGGNGTAVVLNVELYF